jgi:WD40 repeat protein
MLPRTLIPIRIQYDLIHTIHSFQYDLIHTIHSSLFEVPAGDEALSEVEDSLAHIIEERASTDEEDDGMVRDYVTSLSGYGFIGDGNTIAVTAGRCCIKLYDTTAWVLKEVLKGHTQSISACSATPAHPHLLGTSSADGTVRLWDLRTSNASVIGSTPLLLFVDHHRSKRHGVTLHRLPSGKVRRQAPQSGPLMCHPTKRRTRCNSRCGR